MELTKYSDISMGQTAEVMHTVTEEDVQTFGNLSGDFNPLHFDDDWAKKNPNLPTKNIHPTVKPLRLMAYLARLTRTPLGGIVLDPFMGSGTTGMGCVAENRDFIGIELEEYSYMIARKRIEYFMQNEEEVIRKFLS